MTALTDSNTAERLEIVRWTARHGASTAEALSERLGVSLASARARLTAARVAGLLARCQPLAGEPALYTATRSGLRACGAAGLDPARVSAASARHAIACASVAASLERAYPGHYLMGERELQREERDPNAARMASVRLARRAGVASTHRPDLVLWPDPEAGGLPVAVEVELTVKASARLAEICLAWARCRGVAGVLYLVAPEVRRPLLRAIERSNAGGRISTVALDAVSAGVGEARKALSSQRSIPGDS